MVKTNKEILDEYGTILINNVMDRYYRGIRNEIYNGTINPNDKKFNAVFEKLNKEEKQMLKEYIFENFNSLIFDFLNIFEENDQFKLIYEDKGQRVNLVEISEMLKSEPIIENGWIQRFSKELNKDNESPS